MRARDVECSAIADAARSKQLPAIGSNANESSEDISARLAWSDEAESLLELVQEGNTKLWYEGGKSAALRRRPELLGAASLRAHFRTLRFKECGIEALSDAAGFERLEELNVGGNQLRSVRGLPASLRILHAYDNRVRSVSFVRGGAPNLVHLGLGYNSIENVARLAEALELGAPALRCLDLSFNSIVDLRDTALLVSHPALASLWLAGNPVALLPAYRAFIRGEVVLVAEANAAAAAAAELELEKKRIAQEVVGEGTSTRTAPVNLLAQLDGVSIAPRTGAAVAEEQRAYSDEGRRFLRIRINLSAVAGLGAASSSAPPPTAATPAPAPATKRPSSKKGKKGKAAKAEPVAAAEAEACENDGRTKSCAFIVEVVLDGARVHISAEGGEAVLELRPSVELRNALLFDGLRVRILAAGAFVCVRCVPHSLAVPHSRAPPLGGLCAWVSAPRANVDAQGRSRRSLRTRRRHSARVRSPRYSQQSPLLSRQQTRSERRRRRPPRRRQKKAKCLLWRRLHKTLRRAAATPPRASCLPTRSQSCLARRCSTRRRSSSRRLRPCATRSPAVAPLRSPSTQATGPGRQDLKRPPRRRPSLRRARRMWTVQRRCVSRRRSKSPQRSTKRVTPRDVQLQLRYDEKWAEVYNATGFYDWIGRR